MACLGELAASISLKDSNFQTDSVWLGEEPNKKNMIQSYTHMVLGNEFYHKFFFNYGFFVDRTM